MAERKKRCYNFYLSENEEVKSPQSKKEANSCPNNLKEGVARRNLDKELDGSISPDRGVLTDQTVDINSSEDDDDYYDEEENLPIFKRATIGMSSLELTMIIVGGDFNPKYLCRVKPVSVQHNAAFKP